MEIEYVINKDINYNKWDKCIKNSVNPYIYAYSWYLDLVAEDWDALIYNDYELVMPLVFNKKFGMHYIHQPIFNQQLGIFGSSMISKEISELFVNSIPSKFKLIELNFNKYNNVSVNIKYQSKNSNIELNLYKTYDEISKSYSSNLKRNLKKAFKNSLKLSLHTSPEMLIDLFRANKGVDLNVYGDRDYKRLSRLLYTLIYKGMGSVESVVSPTNQLLAAAFFIRTNDRDIFLFSGQSDKAKELLAMPFLIDSYIRKKSNSKKILDFEGSNSEGLKRFYKSFGGQEFYYQSISINKFNFIERILFQLYKKYKS